MVVYYPEEHGVQVPAAAGDPSPLFWGDEGFNRNCYAYAINYTKYKSFNPGSLAPAKALNTEHFDNDLNEITDEEFIKLCVADGLTLVGPVPGPIPANHYMTALFRSAHRAGAPGRMGVLADYHFMRQDSNQNWSHKQKPADPLVTDFAAPPARIVSPTVANMTGRLVDYRFKAYFSCPKAGLKDRANTGSRCCLIATASLEVMGVDEDSEELRLLRWFRDAVVTADDTGRAQVAAYYDTAPAVIANIRARPDAAVVFEGLYRSHIAPSIEAVRNGDHTRAREIFIDALTRVMPAFL